MAVTLISGGTVISAVGRRDADVLIDGEKIVAILAPGHAAAMGVNADRTIDATGKYVVPGGVDVHTHMQLPFGGTEASDTFETGTRAAAWGGVTTIVDFAVQKTGESVQETLAAWHDKAAGECAIDYGFHQIIGGVDEESLKAMTYLVDNEGITSFKMFMAYPGVFRAGRGAPRGRRGGGCRAERGPTGSGRRGTRGGGAGGRRCAPNTSIIRPISGRACG